MLLLARVGACRIRDKRLTRRKMAAYVRLLRKVSRRILCVLLRQSAIAAQAFG